MENRCIICDDIIPEGTQVCNICWAKVMEGDTDEDNKVSKLSV